MTTGGFHEGPFIILDCVSSCAPGRIRAHWNNLELVFSSYQLVRQNNEKRAGHRFRFIEGLIERKYGRGEKVTLNSLIGGGSFLTHPLGGIGCYSTSSGAAVSVGVGSRSPV